MQIYYSGWNSNKLLRMSPDKRVLSLDLVVESKKALRNHAKNHTNGKQSKRIILPFLVTWPKQSSHNHSSHIFYNTALYYILWYLIFSIIALLILLWAHWPCPRNSRDSSRVELSDVRRPLTRPDPDPHPHAGWCPNLALAHPHPRGGAWWLLPKRQ